MLTAKQQTNQDHIMSVNQERYFRTRRDLPTPASLKGKHAGKSALVVGTGTSTLLAIETKHLLKSHFDVIIGINFATKELEEQLDYHIVMEHTPAVVYKEMFELNHRKDFKLLLYQYLSR
jgi:hypothetical protein